MNIIILILIAMGSLASPGQYTAEYKSTHQAEIAQAYAIYDNHYYVEADGGVIIDDSVNP